MDDGDKTNQPTGTTTDGDKRGPTGETGTTNYGTGDYGQRRLMDNGDMVNQLFPSSGRLKTVYSVQHTPMDINGIGRIG